MKTSFISHSPKETKDFARDFAKQILSKPSQKKGALVIGLQGELGAGKTSFAQGFAKGLGVKEKVLSPTFLIMRKFALSFDRAPSRMTGRNPRFQYFYHIDCYRLQNSKELLALGWEKIIGNPQNIILVEWADKIKNILPKGTTSISFETTKAHERRIILS
ncbi:MAG: UPF0079 ATP-binding protein [Parcubacteria group bacterium Greene0714_21]|nr:MAG: UPF0079 ATP-binding protein [Parcubacteria group bacterium Greene0416_39]TSC98332.1 MAG: UPF0079 ATP-binding protein [Parcubacteria group bacterium Greene1014_47]TSD03982.1 MAG: UPF0079 ATP-binding protein [Parcubacteria group bacterium Greene0714_21]